MLETRSTPDRLDSWKEIARYLGRTEKTARRWEQHEGLPVHRLRHAERGSVYAYCHELDAWRAARTPAPRGEGSESPRAAIQAPPSPSPAVSRWHGLVAAIALTGAIGAALLSIPGRRSAAPVPPTLAVLPFESSPDAHDPDLGAAVASAIVDQLSTVDDVRVRPFASSLRRQRAGEEPAVTAERMGVDAIATGRVRDEAGRLTIGVALTERATNAQVWGATYQVDLGDLGTTTATIAGALRDRTIARRGGPTPRGVLAGRLSSHPGALRAYLRGSGFPRNPGRVQIQTSIEYLREAVRLDPDFAVAHGSLALAHVALSFFAELPVADTLGQARGHAERALALDAENAAGHMALAAVSHWLDFDRPTAEDRYRATLAKAPRSAGANNWFADFLIELGRFDEAAAANRAAGEADPGWLEVDVVRGNLLLFQGRPAEAEAVYRRALAVEPNHGLSKYFLGEALLAQGRAAAAVAELRSAVTLMAEPPFARATLARALSLAGERAEAERMLEAFLAARGTAAFPAFAVAEVLVGLGRNGEAIDWLERALDERLFGYYQPSVAPAWRPLHGTPRFTAILQRLGLAAVPVTAPAGAPPAR